MMIDQIRSLLRGSKRARDDPKFLEYIYLVQNGIIDALKTPFYHYQDIESVASVLRCRRKLIQNGEIQLEAKVEEIRREKEKEFRIKYSQ
jgi:hypothetical protein